jgi:hypothetical protein
MILSTRALWSMLLFLGFLWLLPCSLYSQLEQLYVRQVDTITTFVDPFDASDPMHITLTLDLKKYQREKYKGKYMPVHFLYELNDTLFVEKDMRLKARGKFRRSHCNMAPFWLNIWEADEKNKEHQVDMKRIKIVTHCKGAEAYEEYVLKEYLCYKIYNIISPISFRTRLIRMTYVDTGRKNRISGGWAFMIEPENMLAQRTGGIMIKRDDVGFNLMRPDRLDVLSLFQYMVGNTDYSIYGRHNVKMFGLPGFGIQGYTPVPYDFDYTGFVNSYYAVPGENLGINSVRERYYLGPCREDEAFIAAIEHINQYREEILQLVDDFEQLDPKHKKELIAYLEDYFALAGSSNELTNSLKRTCQ